MLLCLLTCCRLRVSRAQSLKERFFFDNEFACMVYHQGECILIEYGNNEILGSLRTEHVNKHQISLRLNEARNKSEGNVKKVQRLLRQGEISS